MIDRPALEAKAEELRGMSVDQLGRLAGAVTGELQYRAETKIAVYVITECVLAAFPPEPLPPGGHSISAVYEKT